MKPPNLIFVTSQGSCYEVSADEDQQRVRWADSRDELEDAEWYDMLWCKAPSIGTPWRFHADDGFDKIIRRVTGPIAQIQERQVD